MQLRRSHDISNSWAERHHPNVKVVNFIPEEIHVLATRLATYVSSDSTTAKVTNQ